MNRRSSRSLIVPVLISTVLITGFTAQRAGAQDRLSSMPGYAQYKKISPEIRGSFKTGALYVTWKDSGKAFEYQRDGKMYRYDMATHKATETGAAPADAGRRGRFRGRRGGPERGRQFTSAVSPDNRFKAFCRERNLWLSDTSGANEFAVTTDGNAKDRTKYATASWVYGEELAQVTAMWWSPDSKKIAYYRFDESKVPDFYLQYNQTKIQDSLDVEPYAKVGAPNPVVDIYVYDVTTKEKVRIDVRDGKPFDNAVTGHYIYDISWTSDGKELLFHRTNRKQNVMELVAADPQTGRCRVVVREEWPASYVDNSPEMQFLKDGRRFIWLSERTGWKNYYLYDLSGKLLATLTKGEFEADRIVQVDEENGFLYYMAHDGENHMKVQLHRVGLNGKGDKRLTDPAFIHSVNMSPDFTHFVDVAETHDTPPVTRLAKTNGDVVGELAKSDLSRFDSLGLKRAELFTFKAADGKTVLHGMLNFPSNFDPGKKYPVLVSVYGGPATNGAHESFSLPSALAEYGFLIASLDSRSAAGRGKRFLDAIQNHLGIVEIDDQAAGVRSLWDRPYVDKNRVGIFGTSYGGTSSDLCLLRYPDVFQAACANSAVTDFRNYDNIYAERYMGLLEENAAGYDTGSAMKYAENLKGALMIYYGTADNNVHPSNALQLIQALQRAKKSFEVQVGPDRGHTAVDEDRMMEFFITNLVMK